MADKEKQAKSIRSLIAEQNKLLKEQVRIQRDGVGTDKEILSDQQDIANVLKDQLKQLKFQKAERASISRITNDLTRISENLSSLGKEELIDKKVIKKLGEDQIKIDKNIRLLQQTKNKLLTDTKGLTEEQLRKNVDLSESIDDQVKTAIKLKVELGMVKDLTDSIQQARGVKLFTGIEKVLQGVPVLSSLAPTFGAAGKEATDVAADLEKRKFAADKFEKLREEGMNIKDALEASGSNAEDVAKNMKGGFSKAKIDSASLNAGFKSIGKSIAKAFGPIAIMVGVLKALVEGDKAASDMAKSMNMSYEDSLAMRENLRASAVQSGNLFVSTKGMQESFMAINQALGTNVPLSNEMLMQMTEMREMAGFTNEELAGIAAISLATGQSMNDITGEFMAQAQMSAQQNGVLLNEKDLLKDIGKISAATTLSFSKNPKLIADAVATAKSLGMELDKVDGIAASLLDFEQSIENELQAELLLNKDINLERARQAALNNDLATVAKEISDQIGSSAEFSEMNRIQQEALAKSVGMSREDLAQTLFVQEQLAGATGEEAKEREALLNRRIQEVGLEQAQKELAEGGVEGLRQQVGLADKLAATTQRINEIFGMIGEAMLPVLEIFGQLFEGIVKPMVGLFGLIFEFTGKIGESISSFIGPLGVVGKLLKTLAGIAIIFAAYKAYSSLASIPVVGAILGGVAAAAILAAGFGALSKVGDLSMDPNGGPIVASPREGGLFQGTKNDALRMGRPEDLDNTTIIQQNTSNKEAAVTNELLQQLVTQNKKKPEISPVGMYQVQ